MSEPLADNSAEHPDQLDSRDLAALVVDSLLRAGMLTDAQVDEAIRVASEEIEALRALGDISGLRDPA